jgi:hypothetical protein
VVSAAENLTRVVGTVRERAPHPHLDGWDVVTLDVDHAEGVPGKADLVSARARGPFAVAVRRELLGDAGAGSRVSARVRWTPQGAMAEPHPDEGAFSVRPPADSDR